MARPRCDPFDAPAIRASINRGETTERAAYLTYAATAARPYARSTFTLMLKHSRVPFDADASKAEAVLDRWRERSLVKPRILSLSAGGGLRVQAGALIAFDGAQTLKYTRAAKPPLAIVLSSAGGFVSIEAVRFCARAGIAIVALNRAHGFLTVMTGAPKVSAALIRAQAKADPLPIARAIVAAKIEAMRCAGAVDRHEPFMIALGRTATVDHIRIIEAQASRVAWPDPPRMKWERGPIDRFCPRFSPSDLRLRPSLRAARGRASTGSPCGSALSRSRTRAAFARRSRRLAICLPARSVRRGDPRFRPKLAS